MNLFEKLKGDNPKLPPKHSIRAILVAWLGGFLAISAVTLASNTFSTALVLGSFGASCVLIFGFPDVPFSQPRNVRLSWVYGGNVAIAEFSPSLNFNIL